MGFQCGADWCIDGASVGRVFYNTPHVANAILLPHVMRFNAGSTNEKFQRYRPGDGVKVEGLSLEEAYAVEAVFTLNRDVGIPLHLRDVMFERGYPGAGAGGVR